jgi:hypothetical protein
MFGAPRFLTGGPITMTAADVINVHRELPGSLVVAVHLEAAAAGIGKDQVLVPEDGATF